jgi:Kef-type K+ transport system membrane component KefB/nucleotide-binding universal stress UspA family protein
MKRIKLLLFYLITIGGFIVLMYWIAARGKILEPGKISHALSITTGNIKSDTVSIFQNLLSNLHHPLAILVLQIITIIFAARIFGILFVKIGQPMVIGEIVAGIVLGPSLIGTLYPGFSNFLFPVASLPNIQFLSQIGLILFMYVVGMDLDLSVLRKKASDAIVISHASIVIPFALGMGLAYFMYIDYAPANISFHSFGLFMAIALSITAFPVLARIIQERGWTRTHIGTMAITCAATDDVTAWCLLAVVIAIAKASSIVGALVTVGIAIAYVLFMIFILKPFIQRIGNAYPNKETLGKGGIAFFFIVLLVSSYLTELIGIHALFGAFIAGVIMPSDINFRKIIIEKIEDISLVLLLPLFFVYTGLRTQIGLLNEGHLWVTCVVVILVATIGKFIGSAAAAKFVGQSWKDSLTLGALMNTRGLMELVVLNIGFDMGILTPEVFTMMVLMALVTTFMTGPAITLILKIFPDIAIPQLVPGIVETGNKILISYGPSISGVKLLRLASEMSPKSKNQANITALHLTKGTEVHPIHTDDYALESVQPLLDEAKQAGIKIKARYKVTNNIEEEILKTSRSQDYDIVLIGSGKSIFTGSLLGNFIGAVNTFNLRNIIQFIKGENHFLKKDDLIHEKARFMFENAACTVGVFIDKDFEKAESIFIPVLHRDDAFLLTFIKKFTKNNQAVFEVFDKTGIFTNSPVLNSEIENLNYHKPNSIRFVSRNEIEDGLYFDKHQLMLVSYEGWKTVVKRYKNWTNKIPSSLIIKPAKELVAMSA